MRRSARLPEKHANLENEALMEPNAKKNRWDKKHSNIATFDNGTMVEAFKFLNYCQLALNSLVSKRFRNVIQAHRHTLALLCIDQITMNLSKNFPSSIKIYNEELSREAYNEWVNCNNYLKQAPLEHQDASTQNAQNISDGYQLAAYAHYKDPNHRELQDRTTVLFARVKLNDKYWPVFEHFVHLLAEPFIYIRWMTLIHQKETFDLLAATIDRSNRDRLQCDKLLFYFEVNSLKVFDWIKDYVRSVKFQFIVLNRSANRGKQLLDFFATGSHCASEILVKYSKLSKAVIDGLVQKFVDLKSCDECHIVQSIRGLVIKPTGEALKSYYAKFFIKEEEAEYGRTAHVFEIDNADIGKKMRLSIINSHDVTLKIINL